MTEHYYRIDETTYSAGVDEWGDPLPGGPTRPNLHAYKARKHTPCGVVIDDYSERGKFINRNWRKQFALPTVEEAIVSYRARKERQIGIYQANIRAINEALHYLNTKGFYYDARKGLELRP
ncbi:MULTISPECIES: hypothetical protein [unclassified Mesorhizobium]|uniref:hypothetical protein n=1 Tax=unclassified Mesorhizobium TaxID=325217 RepID=UPI000FDA5D58|nr:MULTISPECIES: hypothetical protein [unclassified Mesorhizobium]TGT76186.1 hypothetical protein EN809_000750 [Mesorhizobium sp. M2E.F.Ca.ET.166.01.1.1]TGW02301.1 hypothetical protein EN797_000750 [Mesorhizobium sp. M2E.F.Ca.ET.154.01.1.1]